MNEKDAVLCTFLEAYSQMLKVNFYVALKKCCELIDASQRWIYHFTDLRIEQKEFTEIIIKNVY